MIITFGAANLGNIVDIKNDRQYERDEGLMFPGFYNGLNEINNNNNGLSSGLCLASMKENEKLFCPLISLSNNSCKYINNLSFSSPNILFENRTSISIAIVKATNINNYLNFEYYGDKGLSNKISDKKLDVEINKSNIYPILKEFSEPSVNQLYHIDISKNSCGNIEVNNIEIKDNEMVGIFLRCNTIISKTTKSKIGKINDRNLKYISNLKSFTLNLHISEKK